MAPKGFMGFPPAPVLVRGAVVAEFCFAGAASRGDSPDRSTIPVFSAVTRRMTRARMPIAPIAIPIMINRVFIEAPEKICEGQLFIGQNRRLGHARTQA